MYVLIHHFTFDSEYLLSPALFLFCFLIFLVVHNGFVCGIDQFLI